MTSHALPLALFLAALSACGPTAASEIPGAQAPSWNAAPPAMADEVATAMKQTYPVQSSDMRQIVSDWVAFDGNGPVVQHLGERPQGSFALKFIAEILPAHDQPGRFHVVVHARYSNVAYDPDHNPAAFKRMFDVRGTEVDLPEVIADHILALQRAIDTDLDTKFAR